MNEQTEKSLTMGAPVTTPYTPYEYTPAAIAATTRLQIWREIMQSARGDFPMEPKKAAEDALAIWTTLGFKEPA